MSGENQYTFDLGGLTVTGLRIDPDSVGGVPTRLDGVVLNPVQRVPALCAKWRPMAAAVVCPGCGAAFACLAVDVFRKSKKSPVGRCAHGLGAHPQGFYVV